MYHANPSPSSPCSVTPLQLARSCQRKFLSLGRDLQSETLKKMAKKRDRRVAPTSNRPKERVESSTQQDQVDDSASSNRRLIIIFVFFFIVSPAISVLVYSIKFAPPRTESGTDSYVFQRGLIKPDMDYYEILTEHTKVSENSTHRHYTYPVLAYITPWNSRGYDLAKRFNSKFTHLAPVWYDLKSQGSSLVLEGRHNADMGWISELRKTGDARVLPRVVLEAFPKELLTKKKQRNKAINLIVSECKEMGYDGIVLESWSRWAGYGILHDPNMRSLALQFIKQLGHALHSVSSERSLQLIYVIGPPHSEKLQQHDFGPEDLKSLADAVDGFSLMTYDFSNPHSPGPNAPLKWIRSTLQLLCGTTSNSVRTLGRKIFLGINFYGNDFILSGDRGGGAITGRDYLSLLEKHRPIFQWEKNSGEHFFFYSDDVDNRHAVFYPSLMSISLRLEEAHKWGCGISIWEIGQARFDGNSELVAELVTVNGFKAAYAIKDGAEGPRGWVNSSLPWISPLKASLDLSNLTDAISDAIGEGSSGLTVTLGLAATGLGFLAFSEIETILQVLGSAAIIQLVSKKLLFAEDRKETIKQVDEFLNTKIAPKELVDEIKQIGVALLPSSGTSKALPAPTDASPKPTTTDNTPQKAEAIAEPKVEAAAEINSVPRAEIKAESLPGFSKPLSPYPYYPDFKPPTSPTPSQP